MAAPLLEFRDVRKAFRLRNRSDSLRDALPRMLGRVLGRAAPARERFVALDGVSYSVAPGEVLGIVGANGAGKSTSLRLAAGVYRPDGGTVEVRGRVSALIELSAGFHPDLSGRENVFLAGALLGLKERDVRAVYDRIVAFAGIGDFLDSPVRTYSSGMAVRLGFAVAAHVPAEILLVDEVLAVGDLEFRSRCLRRMAERKEEGAAVLFVSHNLSIIEQFCDRVLFLHRGRVLADGRPRETLATYRRHVSSAERMGSVREAATPKLRKGTGALRIDDVRVSGGAGAAAGEVARGGTARVTARWACPGSVRDVRFGVEIHSTEGALVAKALVPGPAGPGGDLPAAGTFAVDLSDLPLLPGLYEVGVFAVEPSDIVFLDYHQRLYTLQVTGDPGPGEDGLVSVEARWSFGGPAP